MTKKEILKNEYQNHGLVIIDFHLGLRLAKPMFINTISAAFIFLSYLVFLLAIYKMFFIQEVEMKILIGFSSILMLLIARYLSNIFAYLYLLVGFLLVVGIFINERSSSQFIADNQSLVYLYLLLLVFSIFTTIVAYRTNRNIIIKDGVLSIPASDVEQSIFAYIIMKPFWGLFYRRKIIFDEIISVKNDGYGSKKKDIYPITVTDINSSNRLVFTSRQKRDEFKTKISILLDLKDYGGSSFGESE